MYILVGLSENKKGGVVEYGMGCSNMYLNCSLVLLVYNTSKVLFRSVFFPYQHCLNEPCTDARDCHEVV